MSRLVRWRRKRVTLSVVERKYLTALIREDHRRRNIKPNRASQELHDRLDDWRRF